MHNMNLQGERSPETSTFCDAALVLVICHVEEPGKADLETAFRERNHQKPPHFGAATFVQYQSMDCYKKDMQGDRSMRKQNVAAVIVFCGFLLTMAVGYFLPKASFSEMEKRYLAEVPDFRWKTVFSGEWGTQVEEYLTDHVPGRNFFVGINAYMELLAGRQQLKNIWLVDGRLLEAPVAMDEKAISRNMQAIQDFAQTLGQKVHLMVVPSAGWAAGVEGYTDEDTLQAIYTAAVDQVSAVPVEEVFRGRPELYYKTDHHWTSQGAYAGYAAYMMAAGKEARAAEDFQVTVTENFQGSTYSRSALWLTPSENIELWKGSDRLTVTNAETQGIHSGIFYWERLEEADKYTVFLDGNHSLVRVQNPDQQGKLLVIRDSYSNCLGGFLAESYGEVVLVDLRYYRQAVSELAAQEQFDDILVCYSCANFLTDTNLMLLR